MTETARPDDPENAAPQRRDGSKVVGDVPRDDTRDSKFPMQADGGGKCKGMPDGVSSSPANGGDPHGRSGGGESGGGAYPNPHAGQEPTWGGFMGHGGQTDIGYHGGGQAGQDGEASPNSTARGDSDYSAEGETGPKPRP